MTGGAFKNSSNLLGRQDEKQDIFYLDEPENEVYKTDNTGLEEDTDDITDAFTSFIDG